MDLKRQLQLEQESINFGIQEYRRKLKDTPITEQSVGLKMMKDSIEPFIEAIRVFRLPISSPPIVNKIKAYFKELSLSDEQLAYITMKVIFNAAADPKKKANCMSTCTQITEHLLDHYEYEKFKALAPNYLKALEKDISNQLQKHKVIMLKKRNKFLIPDTEVSAGDKFMVGKALLDLLIQSTGLFELRCYDPGLTAEHKRWQVVPTEASLAWMNHQHEVCEVMSPFFLPMIIPPKPWTNTRSGGYYTDSITMRNKLVKTRNKETLKALEAADLSKVYSAINSIQETPWRVNMRVLEVMSEVHSSGSTLGGIPATEKYLPPAKPWASDEEYKELSLTEEGKAIIIKWKRAATAIYDDWHHSNGKRTNMETKLRWAKRLSEFDKMYYPHTMDFRGRLYPIVSCGGMHPQGDDTGKSLIELAEGKPLTSDGLFWLMVHGANCYGFDKATFEDRVQWIKDHHAEIIDSAENPLDGCRFWADCDSPYCFLAFCFEYAEYQTNPNMISHIAVAMDGSCNGLQHLSALGLDEIGGASVNLVPLDKPADIYSLVAQKVSEVVVQDALTGDELATLWVGKVDRKMAKRSVMTLPYGAKKYGFKDQLMAELGSRDKGYLDTDDYYKPAIYLAGKLYDNIGDVVIAARQIMDWLQAVARVCNQTGKSIMWTTPMGFKANQVYCEYNSKVINTYWGEMRVQMRTQEETDKLNKAKMSNSISPNFIHSMDSAHLMATVNLLASRGINQFAMIHDSYGCLASDVPVLNECLREAFIAQYSEDLLTKFREEILSQIPEELHKDIPPVPPKGNLDLNQVRHSRYFFA